MSLREETSGKGQRNRQDSAPEREVQFFALQCSEATSRSFREPA